MLEGYPILLYAERPQTRTDDVVVCDLVVRPCNTVHIVQEAAQKMLRTYHAQKMNHAQAR
jgi:hypothetical protein